MWVDDFQALTDAQVASMAKPGESWEAARFRLELEREVGTDTGDRIGSVRVPYGTPMVRPDQLDALRAYQQLSSREQFESWGFCPERLAALERARSLKPSPQKAALPWA